MIRRTVAASLPASPDARAAIRALDLLLAEREQQAKQVAILTGGVHEARVDLDKAETAERRGEGPGAYSLAVAATQEARDKLAAAARALAPAQGVLRELDVRIAAAWRSVQEATRPGHLAAEAAAEADLRAAAAQVGHAARRLNDIRHALGTPHLPRVTIRDPADATLNAADVASTPDGAPEVPLLPEISRLRIDIEVLRGR